MLKFDGELLEMPVVLPIAYKCVKAENHLEGHSPGKYHLWLHALLQHTQDGQHLLTGLILLITLFRANIVINTFAHTCL